ncbi:predicted protein [Nematostella vectensis]|uniref:Importin-13 n=1 Tax=Nematostella vectensis TaxID=45351 RepID=A7RKB0_NEMVE|nr:predicted protein [Nematostella vectensis]|eukprot:XP_001640279.1 predicted protein [Nematostella vectensis]
MSLVFRSELIEEHYGALRTEILNHILLFARGPKIVSTRLCVALGAFALQMMPEHWTNAVSDIISSLQNVAETQDNAMYNVLLEVLTVLPEEFMSAQLNATRKMELRGELQTAMKQVLKITEKGVSSHSTPHNRLQTLRCLCSWIQFGCSIADIVNHLPSVFEALSNPELFDCAVDLLVDVVTHPTSHRYPSYLWNFISSLVQYHSTLHEALQSGDMDTASGLCRVVTSVVETHTNLLLEPDTEERQQLAMQVVQITLECTNAPGWYPVDDQCSEMTFSFWYTLQDEICSKDPEPMMQLRAAYMPVFSTLTQVFLRKVQYPPETEWAQFSSDEKDQFRYYRQDVADTMIKHQFDVTLSTFGSSMYIYCIMRDHLLHQLYSTLYSLLTNETPSSWQSVEATLYLVQSISENVEPEEESYMPAIFSLLSQLPPQADISQTALLMVGSYSEWLKCHPDQLRTVLPVLLGGLSQADLASASTQALRGICEECVQDLDTDVQQTILTHCQAALAGKVIKERERIRCMECIGYTLSYNPLDRLVERLQSSVGPYVHLLAQVVTQQPSQDSKQRLQFYLKMFAVLFKCLDPEIKPSEVHPSAVVLKEIMPSLKSLQPWIGDNDVIQDLCLCLERAIDTIRDHMDELVAIVGEIFVLFFTDSSSPALLDSAAMFVGMYGCEEKHFGTVAEVFQKLISHSLCLLQTSVRDHGDILQNFMQLVMRGLKANAKMVFNCEDMAIQIVQCGLTAIELPETYAVRAACRFWVEFVNTCEASDFTRRTLDAYGQHLVDRVIKGIGGGVPRPCAELLAEILVALNKHCKDSIARWMQPFIAVEGFPSTLVNTQQKQNFYSSVMRGHSNKKRVKDAVKEFSLLCRGLYGTEYAAAYS